MNGGVCLDYLSGLWLWFVVRYGVRAESFKRNTNTKVRVE